MEYLVGVSNKDVKVRPLIENRLPTASRLCGQIKILQDYENYVEIEFYSREQLFELADILADIVMENLQIRFIMREIATGYCYVAEKDQCEILVNTLKKLWYEDGKGGLERMKKDISNRIAVCMLETKGHILSLDGVVRFRMQDCVEQWKDALELCVDDYLFESERKEFVKLLRYFVSMRDPAVKYVEIRLDQNEYQLFDDSSSQVSVFLPGAQSTDLRGITKEDLLLSRLINLSPEAIDVSGIEDEDLKDLIGQIFIGRIRGL